MFEHGKLNRLEDYFIKLSQRPGNTVYFYRINGYTEKIQEFLRKYYESAVKSGIVIEGKIPNPEEHQLNYYEEIMGLEFRRDAGFIIAGLARWLPRMNEYQRKNVASSLYDTLEEMQRAGKNDNMQKNAYIKFMCWLYYKFERIVNRLGQEEAPKILYEGSVSNYELKMLSVLSKAGSDIVLLQPRGDEEYQRLDPSGLLSDCLKLPEMKAFPDGFGIRSLREEDRRRQERERLYGGAPRISPCTNAWIQGEGLKDVLTDPSRRGEDPGFFYNCFIRINGVEDKASYLNELFQFRLELKNRQRHFTVLEETIPRPTVEEINSIQRKNYNSTGQMLLDLSKYIRYTANQDLERLMKKAFVDVLSLEEQAAGANVNRLINKAVYLLCWLKRYQSELFVNWKAPDIGCLIYLGGCQNENEAMFLRFLSRLPADVLLLKPNLHMSCCLRDDTLYEVHYEQSMAVGRFPGENDAVCMGTAAYHAEQELDTIIYQDSGLYRNQQYEKAVSVILRTMYEEIAILWDQEVKYRPNFSVTDNQVNIPVIFAKVSGVKDGQVSRYWADIKALATGDAYVIRQAPYIRPGDENPVKPYAAGFFKNGKLLKEKIKTHACYQYGFLREEMQEHILDKLKLLIDSRLIRGTFENGTEYTIIATVLNLSKEIVRLLQRFDFTKKNPKLIYIHTSESMISLEDTILTAFLSLAGFDVVFFVPTGYQSIEKYFNRQMAEEHQVGEYMYDLRPPAFNGAPPGTKRSWREKIFKRGN